MKKTILLLSAVFLSSLAFAGHRRYFSDADDITSGTLSPYRLNSDKGNNGQFLKSNGDDTMRWSYAGSPYDAVVGTRNSLGSDSFVGSPEQFNIVLASFGARGCTYGLNPAVSTVSATIAFRPGVYAGLQGSTIPAGVNVVGIKGSSTVWQINDKTTNGLTVYGTISGITFDFGNVGFTAPAIVLSSGAKLLDCKIIGPNSSNGTGDGAFIVSIRRSSGVVVDGLTIMDAKSQNPTTGGQIGVHKSINTVIRNVYMEEAKANGGTEAMVSIAYSTNTIYENGTFNKLTAIGIILYDGCVNTIIRNNRFLITTGAGSGSLALDAQGGTAISTFTWIIGNEFYYYPNVAQPVVRITNNGSVYGLLAQNNVLYNEGTGNVTFMTVMSKTYNAVFNGNAMWDKSGGAGAFISDNGVGTISASVANFLNNKEQ